MVKVYAQGKPERDNMTSVPQDPSGGHEPAGPEESLLEIQEEVQGHSPEEQAQPPDADAEDLYGSP